MFFYYNDEKECVSCSFANSENNLYEKMELSVEEAEELEYKIILSGNYETAGRAQFVPMLEKYDL